MRLASSTACRYSILRSAVRRTAARSSRTSRSALSRSAGLADTRSLWIATASSVAVRESAVRPQLRVAPPEVAQRPGEARSLIDGSAFYRQVAEDRDGFLEDLDGVGVASHDGVPPAKETQQDRKAIPVRVHPLAGRFLRMAIDSSQICGIGWPLEVRVPGAEIGQGFRKRQFAPARVSPCHVPENFDCFPGGVDRRVGLALRGVQRSETVQRVLRSMTDASARSRTRLRQIETVP